MTSDISVGDYVVVGRLKIPLIIMTDVEFTNVRSTGKQREKNPRNFHNKKQRETKTHYECYYD